VSFADLKNDFVFRRIFAKHPDLLRGLLNDQLDRQGDRAIVAIEYLPSEQLPLVAGAPLPACARLLRGAPVSIPCDRGAAFAAAAGRPIVGELGAIHG
jgi:hypothetical protein